MQFLCDSEVIEEGMAKGFELKGESLFAVRRNGNLFVYLNRCPHQGVALHWFPDKFLDPEGELIQCSTHGARFVIETGRCVAGPCAGESLLSIVSREEAGKVWVDL